MVLVLPAGNVSLQRNNVVHGASELQDVLLLRAALDSDDRSVFVPHILDLFENSRTEPLTPADVQDLPGAVGVDSDGENTAVVASLAANRQVHTRVCDGLKRVPTLL